MPVNSNILFFSIILSGAIIILKIKILKCMKITLKRMKMMMKKMRIKITMEEKMKDVLLNYYNVEVEEDGNDGDDGPW